MNTAQLDEREIDTTQRIGIAGGLALLAAGLTLVIVVLPAEYGVDPLGTGARLGLLPLGIVGQQVDALNQAAAARDSAHSAVVMGQEHPFHEETVEFRIEPHD